MIEFVVRGRQEGKTTELARWAVDNPDGKVLCMHGPAVRPVQAMITDLLIDAGVDPAAAHQRAQRQVLHPLRNRRGGAPPFAGRANVKIAIDDVDVLIREYLGADPVMVAATGHAVPGLTEEEIRADRLRVKEKIRDGLIEVLKT